MEEATFEETLAELEDLFLRNGIKSVASERLLAGDSGALSEFVSACHAGWHAGQPKLLAAIRERQSRLAEETTKLKAARRAKDKAKQSLLSETIGKTAYQIAVLRKIADTIAWTLFQEQHWISRRFYIGEEQPKLAHNNSGAVLQEAQGFHERDPLSFALMTDLTSFIQVGDLLIVNLDPNDPSSKRLGLAEVKHGEKNAEIRELLDFYYEKGCPNPLLGLVRRDGSKTEKQIGRMMRQDFRQAAVAEVINSEEGKDLLTGLPVKIAPEPIETEDYDEVFAELDTYEAKGASVAVVDECLYVGLFDSSRISSPYLEFSHHLFHVRMGDLECPDPIALAVREFQAAIKPPYPIGNLIHGVSVPLAVPIFMRRIGSELINDLLLGRASCLIYLDIDAFLSLLQQQGLSTRWVSRREQAKHKMGDVLRVGGKAIECSLDGVSMVLGDGILSRMLYDGMTPSSAVAFIKASLVEAKYGP